MWPSPVSRGVMLLSEKMKFHISDKFMLRIYGTILLLATLNLWISISGVIIIPIFWVAALCAVVVYNRQFKGAILTAEWIIRIWAALFIPKTTDPMVTNIGKIHWLVLCILALFGVDALVTPIHIQTSSTPFDKTCWILSLFIAVAGSIVLFKYSNNKNKA